VLDFAFEFGFELGEAVEGERTRAVPPLGEAIGEVDESLWTTIDESFFCCGSLLVLGGATAMPDTPTVAAGVGAVAVDTLAVELLYAFNLLCATCVAAAVRRALRMNVAIVALHVINPMKHARMIGK